ncbi:MAG: chemotaxis-specific protein-glutamate methyltransferase CheB [Desulfomonilaceae bacterium]|nr:chemotaxis-specific protein-glutamate methyltransferase CheB [Desulfomonilaceae bacterium]
MTKVLIVEDSAVSREVLTRILSSDPEIEVIGTANNGEEALRFLERSTPDVVTMDIIMPRMDGYETTRRIMESRPLPVVVVSASVSREEVRKSWKAVDAGAVAVLEKPGFGDIGVKGGSAEKLIETVKIMSQVKVVGRRARPKDVAGLPAAPPPTFETVHPSAGKIQVVAVGASTGGPPAIREILARLPSNFGAPILIVQHITPGFTQGFVDWLNGVSPMTVQTARDGERALPGNVYVAPDRCQMGIDRGHVLRVQRDDRRGAIAPSVASLFKSIVEAFGDRSLGVLLTGMGRDGARELKLMRDRGAPTIAQDKESCVIYGMPGEAMKLDAVKYSLHIERIGEMLCSLVMGKRD